MGPAKELVTPAAATTIFQELPVPAKELIRPAAGTTIFQELPVPAKELVNPAGATLFNAEVDTGSMFDSEDVDVDLGRLCAAFRSLEQLQAKSSTPVTYSGAKSSTPVTCSGRESSG